MINKQGYADVQRADRTLGETQGVAARPRDSGARGSGRSPLRRFAVVIFRTPRYAGLAANLARDGRLSVAQKAGAGSSLGYAVLPFDLLPGIIPVAGQLDDLTVLIGGLRAVLRSCPLEVADDHLARSGLTFEIMDADLATVRDTALWLGRRGARLLGEAARASAGLVRTTLRIGK